MTKFLLCLAIIFCVGCKSDIPNDSDDSDDTQSSDDSEASTDAHDSNDTDDTSIPAAPNFYVEGRFLYDPAGNKVVLNGTNTMTSWTDREAAAFSEIAKTGANAIRITVLDTDSPEDIAPWIEEAVDNNLIPILNNCDYIAKWPIRNVLDWYTAPSMIELIQTHQMHLLINIADEAGIDVDPDEFEEEYKYIIQEMRAAGIHVPLIVDGLGWGQDIAVFHTKGPALIEHDPDHNLLFNLTAYAKWEDASKMAAEIQASMEMELPLMIGEWSVNWYEENSSEDYCGCCVPWETLLKECHENEIGQLVWSWGPGNLGCEKHDMTTGGTVETLTDSGREIFFENEYSICNTSVPSPYILQQNGAAPTDCHAYVPH